MIQEPETTLWDVDQPVKKNEPDWAKNYRVEHPIFGYHTPEDDRGFCQSCGGRWPCDVADALAETHQLHAIAKAARALLDAWPKFVTVYLSQTRFGRAVARLEAALDGFEDWRGDHPYRREAGTQ